MNASPWNMLGLPDPEGNILQDQKLRSTYKNFCKSLECDPDSRFIKCSGGFYYHVPPFWVKEDEFSRVQLLSALYNPSKSQKDDIRSRFKSAAFSCYRQFLQFRKNPDYKSLTRRRSKGDTIGIVKSQSDNAPGMTCLEELHISSYNEQWATATGEIPDPKGNGTQKAKS